MESDIAGRDVRSESLRRPLSIARRMSAVAGVLVVAAIVVGIPEAQRRLTLLLHLDVESPAPIFTGLAAFAILFVLYGIPAIWLLHGEIRFRAHGPVLDARVIRDHRGRQVRSRRSAARERGDRRVDLVHRGVGAAADRATEPRAASSRDRRRLLLVRAEPGADDRGPVTLVH